MDDAIYTVHKIDYRKITLCSASVQHKNSDIINLI